MAPRMGTSVSTHNSTLAHFPGRDGSCSGSTLSLGRLPPPLNRKQGLGNET